MNGAKAYGVFMGIRLHFTQKGYDYPTYGPKKVSETELGKNYVLANAVGGKFTRQEDLEIRLVSLFKHKSVWLQDVCSAEAQTLHNKHLADVGNYRNNLEEHVRLISSEFPDIMQAFKSGSSLEVPPIGRYLLTGKITIETYVCLDNLLDFSKDIGDLIWKDQKLRVEKYKAFFKPDMKEVARIVRPFFQ